MARGAGGATIAGGMSEPIRYFFPGPTYVLEEVRAALTAEVAPHRSAEGKALYGRLAAKLPPVFRTAGEVYLATGSSTLIMEAALVSLVEGEALHLVNGAFSERWAEIAETHGRRADRLAVPWGEVVEPDLVRAALRRQRYAAVTVVHNETSTGVVNPIAEIARAVAEESDALLLVDAVSSLAAAPVETDAWGLDLVLAGVQKGLAVPPGLTVFSLSERAAERAARVGRRGYYTDLLRYRAKHRQGGPITTPAISLCRALDRQLDRILAEGLEARWARHRALAERVATWAERSGCAFAACARGRSATVSCLRPPPGVAAAKIVADAAARGFVLGGGYGEWKASTFRIGHLGEVRMVDLDRLLEALDEVLLACLAC